MNDYRESINQNTNEIQANYEFLCRLDSRIDKMSERIDELSMFIQQMNGAKTEYDFTVSALTTKEQEVFMAIYSSDAEMTYRDIARRTCLTENLVICYVTNLITKGVRVTKRYMGDDVLIGIEPTFKTIQAKHNILKINEGISQAIIA